MELCEKMTAVCLGVSLSLATTPAVAGDMDVLSQPLEQNFPTQQNPLEVLAISKAEQVEAQAMMTGSPFSSQSALIMNNKTGEILYQKNANRVMPIALISKLMSAIVLLGVDLNMNELVTTTLGEIDQLKSTGNRLSIGMSLSRKELLHLSLMSSEDRATHALVRTYPGGINAFVAAMSVKAQSLGMSNSRPYESASLDYRNVSITHDLSRLVTAASKYSPTRHNSTSNYGAISTVSGSQRYKNSDVLVYEGGWSIELQKTGYIRETGRSMTAKADVQNQPITIVLLNSPSPTTRVSNTRKIESRMSQRHS